VFVSSEPVEQDDERVWGRSGGRQGEVGVDGNAVEGRDPQITTTHKAARTEHHAKLRAAGEPSVGPFDTPGSRGRNGQRRDQTSENADQPDLEVPSPSSLA
jgi:hypothetical protein